MKSRTLIGRSLRHHWRSHLGVVLGSAVGSAALIGALVVGDSVRLSLREGNLAKLGATVAAVSSGDRFFAADLEARLADAATARQTAGGGESSRGPGAFLLVPGSIARGDATARANNVQVISTCYAQTNAAAAGTRFWAPGFRLSPQWDEPRAWSELEAEPVRLPAPGSVLVNEVLARQLRVEAGETVVVRLHKPGLLPSDAAIADHADSMVALRLVVEAVIPAASGGDFSLRTSQLPPYNAFVRHDELSRALELQGRANVLGLGPAGPDLGPLEATRVWSNMLETVWLPRDAELVFTRPDPTNGAPSGAGEAGDHRQVTLQSRRVFLDAAAAEAALTPARAPGFPRRPIGMQPRADEEGDPGRAASVTDGVPLLTYLVNLLQSGERTTPYSMVAATTAPYVPADLRDDEIVVNQWLAEDLQLAPGHEVALSYYVVDSGSALVERTNRFRVHSIVPLAGRYADRSLMPEFPGVARAERTQDWDTGFPLIHKIRDKDEEYWEQHRGTPKAFVTVAAGQEMWANRFGTLTAVRYFLPPGMSADEMERIVSENLVANLAAAEAGLQVEPVRARALQAASQSQDFGGLFIGFSFFLILAALILMALLFQFGLEQRVQEIGTLLALGFRPHQVRRLYLAEGVALAAVGGLVGLLGGLVYAWAMLRGLTTIWRAAVSTSALSFHVTAGTLAAGAVASVLVGAFAIWLTLRKQARQSARELLAGDLGGELRPPAERTEAAWWRRGTRALLLPTPAAWLTLTGALALLGYALGTGDKANAGIFFGAGMLLLVSGIAFTAAWLRRRARPGTEGPGRSAGAPTKGFTPGALAARGLTRRRSRSLAVASLLACGSFLIAAIGAFRLDANQAAGDRASGTGGFALLGESALPVVRDLNTRSGREFYALNEAELQGVGIVPLRVREGDEASCLNLNRAQQPRLLGVDPQLLASRGAFTFAQTAPGLPGDRGWRLLEPAAANAGATPDAGGSPAAPVPAIGDLNSILWAMGKKVGDTIEYVDDQGRTFPVRIVGAVANSILQGNLLIAEEEFVRRFPGTSGYRMVLIDAPTNRVAAVSATLTRALRDVGLELTPAARRLAEFNAVQNTYLNTFQILGGLGLLLGTAGLGVVVLRNVLERRGELALLLAVGFRRRALRRLVLREHAGLLALGLGIGVAAALVAILPQWLAPEADINYLSLGLTLAAVLASGLMWTWLATRVALRGHLINALRNE